MAQVDLGFGNSIISAFLAGQQQALAKKKLIQDKETETAQLEERKKEHEAQIKQQQDELANRQEEYKKNQAFNQSLHDLAVLQAKQKIGKEIETPEDISQIGGQIEGTQFDQTGQYPTSISFSHPLLGNVTMEHPEARRYRIGQEAEAIEAPKRITRENVAEETTQRAIKTQEAITARQNQLQEDKLDFEKEKYEAQLKNAIEVANIKGNYSLKARQITADKIKNLPPAVQNKVNDFNLLENKTLHLKQLLETNGGYEKFYKGRIVGGSIADIGAAFGGDQQTEEIRQLAAEIEADAKNMIGKFGGALTRTELDILEHMAPSPNRNITPVRARSIVPGFLLGVQNIKGELADTYKVNQKTSETLPKKTNRVKVDAQGNEIK